MPWRETRPMDQRKEFVREYRRGLYSMTELAERYDVSRKTGCALVRRVEEFGMAGLAPQSRRPHSSPTRTPDHIAALLIKTQGVRDNPEGSRALLALLATPRRPTRTPHRTPHRTPTVQRDFGKRALRGGLSR